MTTTDEVASFSVELVAALSNAGKSVATAESCTGGWIAKAITDVDGSSTCFGYGVVSYSNDAKVSLLGVHPHTLAKHGAVSRQTVSEMSTGALDLSGADIAVAVSGIAGPGGGSSSKPVGTVWFGWASRAAKAVNVDTELHLFDGERDDVRRETVALAIKGLLQRLRSSG